NGGDIGHEGSLLLHPKQSQRVKVHKERLWLEVLLDDLLIRIALKRSDVLALKPEGRLVVLLRRCRVLEVQHRVPLFNGATSEHAIDREREGLSPLGISLRDCSFNTLCGRKTLRIV